MTAPLDKIATPTDQESAIEFLKNLYQAGLDYHPDESAVDCLPDCSDAEEIDKRMQACFPLVGDPCLVLLSFSNSDYFKERFEAFRNSRKLVQWRDMPDHMSDLYDGGTFFLYADETWIRALDGGKFHLQIERDEYESHDLDALERILFEWIRQETD